MQFHNYLFLGSFTAFALLGTNAGLAQSSGSVPAHISGGHAEFTPTVKIPGTGAATSGGTPTDTTLLFPLPAMAGHPGISIVAKSPAFVAHGSFFFPLSSRSQPEKTGDFVLEGEIAYSLPQEKIFILFSQFRVDTSGNVFARFTVNGQAVGGREIELLTAAGTSTTTDATKFTISATEHTSAAFAQAVNNLFQTTVLTPGEELATLSLVAHVAQ
ncbi:MAG TPA: hypothetical protein VE641_14750 [Chthoniobacterales bacterium]|jgi:hypothetical protein|nr:hypothetical protein [Chthoniobacterales bacterium]